MPFASFNVFNFCFKNIAVNQYRNQRANTFKSHGSYKRTSKLRHLTVVYSSASVKNSMTYSIEVLIDYVQEVRSSYIKQVKYRCAQRVKPTLSLKDFTNYSSMNSHPVDNP